MVENMRDLSGISFIKILISAIPPGCGIPFELLFSQGEVAFTWLFSPWQPLLHRSRNQCEEFCQLLNMSIPITHSITKEITTAQIWAFTVRCNSVDYLTSINPYSNWGPQRYFGFLGIPISSVQVYSKTLKDLIISFSSTYSFPGKRPWIPLGSAGKKSNSIYFW